MVAKVALDMVGKLHELELGEHRMGGGRGGAGQLHAVDAGCTHF